MSTLNSADYPNDAQELYQAYWDFSTFTLGAHQAADEYRDKFHQQDAQRLAQKAELFYYNVDDIRVNVLTELGHEVRVVAEEARVGALEDPTETRRLTRRIEELHQELYLECVRSLAHGLDEAKNIAEILRKNPEQARTHESLSSLDHLLEDTTDILNRDVDPEARFEDEEIEDEEENDSESGYSA